jgi:hypothetical protein
VTESRSQFGKDVVMRFIGLLSIAFCTLLVGCERDALRKILSSPEDELIVSSYVDLLRHGQYEQIESNFDSSLMNSNIDDTLGKMAALFPPENPESIKLVGLDVSRSQENPTKNVTLEYHFPSKWLLVNVAIERKRDVSKVVGFHVNLIPDSLENLNKFTLVRKSAIQYLILTSAVCSLLFSFYVLTLCVQTNVGRTKWLWILFVLTGVGQLAVNWTTGRWTFTLLSIQLPCGRAFASPYGPWTVVATLPAGAFLFLNHRSKMRVAGELIDPPTHGPT